MVVVAVVLYSRKSVTGGEIDETRRFRGRARRKKGMQEPLKMTRGPPGSAGAGGVGSKQRHPGLA